jgi:tetratricopeptide (TPR) repeat protein
MATGISACILVAVLQGAPAADLNVPPPLPPPPELLDGLSADGYQYLPPVETGDGEATRRALEPPETVDRPAGGEAAIEGGVPAAQAAGTPGPALRAGRGVLSDVTISMPAANLPAEYFDPPLDDAEIPGVLLPEIDESFLTEPEVPGYPSSRSVVPGMSIRQLAPFFALAKGSEAAAIEAKRTGDDALFADQIAKAVSAYADIVAMADAGNEAREEAWYGIARCEYRRGNWWKAFDAIERSFPGKFDRSEVAGRIRLEMFIGEHLWRLGEARVPDASSSGEILTGYQAASLVYAAAIFNQPAAADAPLALLRRGDAAAMDRDWEAAEKFYRQAVEYYPESESAMQARSSLAEMVMRRYSAELPEAARSDLGSIMDDVERADVGLSEEAEERRRRAVAVANDMEAETKLRHAKEYLKNVRVRKSRDAAVFLLGDVVSHFPGTVQAGEAAGILRGMGIEPPMTLSDGSRFPITSGWNGRRDGDEEGLFPGGSIIVERQDGTEGISEP